MRCTEQIDPTGHPRSTPRRPGSRDTSGIDEPGLVPAPSWIVPLLGYRAGGQVPNTADRSSKSSVALAAHILEQLGVEPGTRPRKASDSFEPAARTALQSELELVGHGALVGSGSILGFEQYRHLRHLDDLVHGSPFLSSQIGRDYLIDADITVSLDAAALPELPPCVTEGLLRRWNPKLPPVLETKSRLLHALISLKWSIRSDRVQNIRHEAVILTRTRRGRQPHIAVVTLEPLPSRLASIARGTGEIDAVYHLLYEELWDATMTIGSSEQRSVLFELVENGRLRPWNWLVPTLVAS